MTRDPATVTASLAPSEPGTAPLTRKGFPHRVRAGEDFASISRYYYGTPKHAAALWIANRQRVAAPDALRPGLEIVVPPAQLLPAAEHPERDREQTPLPAKRSVIPEGERDPTGQPGGVEPAKPSRAGPKANALDPGSRSRSGNHSPGFLNRFQVQELASWPVPPGVSREEALKNHGGDPVRGMLQRFAPKRADTSRAEATAPVPPPSSSSPPPAVAIRPSLGLRLFGAGRKSSQAMPDAGASKR
ncbi:LysM peptidoglycan-binding domain-containing protein [Singulisphaera sp. GP187]|uniref:LysM peptidoglycan-binding domain-containing protein n=1 Tax=Singulisphaera sp. GP187 TaxID=1882752 RepID=UPI0009419719|nr:LysM peptidoglycan-binding domain-containing protein [Singulisphaera sp. GP187]